ncbi:MAG: substrate-binding domain-containing protein [Clostridiales bacterium]|nr:substrate-binding domain-containing protein [Clostridiales bacterium]
MKKRLPALLLALALVLGLVLLFFLLRREGPAPVADRHVPIVGFSQLGSESGWRVGNSRDVIAAAQRAGVELIYENAGQKQENQFNAIRSFIAYQVDVIALAPIVEEGWDNVLREAREAGIPVLLSDRYINIGDESLFAGYVGSDFLEEGKAAARFLMRKAAGMARVNIVEIAGTEGSTPAKQRASGFRDTLGADERFRIIHSVSGDFLRSKGKENMRNILARFDEIDVLYSHNDAMTLGAIEAIEEAGLSPGQDIIIITIDGEQGAIDLLKQGKINCVVECTPLLGDLIMDLAQRLARGEDIPRVSHPKERVFSEFDEDVQRIPPRGY